MNQKKYQPPTSNFLKFPNGEALPGDTSLRAAADMKVSGPQSMGKPMKEDVEVPCVVGGYCKNMGNLDEQVMLC